ncbi:unnamed protein product [Allacma fusca]|uniref:Ionotropic glutamate receptor L-glutamate and glycine-binding domain-containing protein n=1 Tax=Allacma fusca TaxID=39272 RepID=A0A8J2LW99_9HEXA|nr:unnamed protein product [Allacma fusca]
MDNSLSKMFNAYSHILLKDLKSLSRGDEDHYLFLTESTSLAEKILFWPKSMELKYKIVMFLDKSGQIQLQTLCFYCKEGQAEVKNLRTESIQIKKDLFPDFANQGNGRALRASCQTRVFFIFEIKKTNDEWKFQRGYAWSLLATILHKFNFTYVAFPANRGGGSGTLKNGEWDGAVRDILDNVADISVAVTTGVNRFEVITGTKPMAFEYLNFMLGEPKKIFLWGAIWRPLNPEVWFWVFVTTVSLSITLKTTLKFSHLSSGSHGHFHIFENVVIILLEQNVKLPPQIISELLCAMWLCAGLVLCTAYKSKLVGLMTFPAQQKQPQSYAELAQSDFSWGLEGASVGSSAHNFFLNSPSPLFKKIYQKMEFEPIANNCIMRAMTTNFACLTFNGQAEYIIYRNYTTGYGKPPLKLSPDSAAPAMPGIAMRKRSIYRTNFDRVVDSSMEMGIIKKWKWMDFAQERRKHFLWEKSNQIHAKLIDPGPPALVLKHLLGPYITLAVGYFLGGFTLGLEYFLLTRFR